MILSDVGIRTYGSQLIEPFVDSNVQPASVDLTLDDLFVGFKGTPPGSDPFGNSFIKHLPIDLGNINETAPRSIYEYTTAPDGYWLAPQSFVLGSTVESVSIPRDLVARVEGKSSLGRLGLLVHATAGFVDPGFSGRITLEFYNLNPRPIILRPGLRICQVSFDRLTSNAAVPYGSEALGSKEQGQSATTPSKYRG